MSMEIMEAISKEKDWHASKHIRKRARYLLEHPDEQIPSDVTFLVGDGKGEPKKLFNCHKFILAMVSSMFQAMFYGTFPETKGPIEIPDITPKAFGHMLRFAYTDEVDFRGEDSDTPLEIMDTLYCAKKYLITKLATICRNRIQDDIHLADFDYYCDVCQTLEKARFMDENDLAGLALAEIARYTKGAMQMNDFRNLSPACLKEVLEQPALTATESDIFQGVLRWLEHNFETPEVSWREAFRLFCCFAYSSMDVHDGTLQDQFRVPEEMLTILQYLFPAAIENWPFAKPARPSPPKLWAFCFDLVYCDGGKSEKKYKSVEIIMRPDLAPECCRYLREAIDGEYFVNFTCVDNGYSRERLAIPPSLAEERSVLSHSAEGACWFEWETDWKEGGLLLRINAFNQLRCKRSAVFGILTWFGKNDFDLFRSWDMYGSNSTVKRMTNFSIKENIGQTIQFD